MREHDPWAELPEDEALARVRKSVHPRWKVWTVKTFVLPGRSEQVTMWCASRRFDGALTHADHPGRLLQHIAYADEDEYLRRRQEEADRFRRGVVGNPPDAPVVNGKPRHRQQPGG